MELAYLEQSGPELVRVSEVSASKSSQRKQGATATTSPNVSRSVAAPNRASDVEYDRCFSALTTTAVQVTSPAADGKWYSYQAQLVADGPQ